MIEPAAGKTAEPHSFDQDRRRDIHFHRPGRIGDEVDPGHLRHRLVVPLVGELHQPAPQPTPAVGVRTPIGVFTEASRPAENALSSRPIAAASLAARVSRTGCMVAAVS